MGDTPQQRAILRRSPLARKVRARFPEGTRVVAADIPPVNPAQGRRFGTMQGTVKRHVPGLSAQGGSIVVLWDNGVTGSHSAGTLAVVEDSEIH